MFAEEAYDIFMPLVMEEGKRLIPPELPHKLAVQSLFGFHARIYPIARGFIFAIVDAKTGTLVDYGAADCEPDAQMELLRWFAERWHELTALHDGGGEVVIAYAPPRVMSAKKYEARWEAIFEQRRQNRATD